MEPVYNGHLEEVSIRLIELQSTPSIELGYNEITAYIEVSIFSYNHQTVHLTPFIARFGNFEQNII